jgi:recombination protein RecT
MSTALAPAKPDILLMMASASHQIAPFVPKGMNPDQVVQQVYWATKKTPALLSCDFETVVHSVITILGWQLVIGETAYLIPFKDTATGKLVCTPVADYKGLAHLMIESHAVRAILAEPVFEHDDFAFQYGTHRRLDHRPVGDPKKRGALVWAYCIFDLGRNLGEVFKVMSIEEIEVIRKTYSKKWHPTKVPVCPPWYAVKTVIRAAADLVPKTLRTDRYERALQVMTDDAAIESVDGDDVTQSAVMQSPAEQKEAGRLLRAQTSCLMGFATSFDGYGQKPLAAVPDYVLRAALKFFSNKLKARSDSAMESQVSQIDLVLRDRAARGVTVGGPPKPAMAASHDDLPFD